MPANKKMQLILTKCNIICLSIGAALLLLGLTSITFFSQLHNYIIKSALKLGPDTEAFKAWQKPKTPITMDIYFFNWTNPEDIYNSSIKPNFVEMGPYRYRHIKEKVNLTWNHENETVTYRYLKHYYFDEENSPCHEDDLVTTLNMVALTAAHIASDWNIIFKHTVKFSMLSSEIYVQKTVRELLFDGYEDPILATANAIPFLSDGKSDRFGWFHGRNGSVGTDGAFNMATTQDDRFGTLKRWNYNPRTEFYEGHCADIYGSGGEMYPRNTQPTKIEFFSPEMCRSVQFNFKEEVTVKDIPGYKYLPGAEVFDNGTEIPENVCYCNGECMPSGVMNVSSCREDAPVFLSLPHFYKADPVYLDAVDGLEPNGEKHELYITLEPNTGIIADISARMQVNVFLRPLSDFSLFYEVPSMLFPIFWFEQKVVLSDELASGLSLLFNLPNINRIISILLILVGLLCILSVVLYIICYKKRKIREHKITREEIPLKAKS